MCNYKSLSYININSGSKTLLITIIFKSIMKKKFKLFEIEILYHENKEFFIEFYKNNEHRFIANRNFIKNYENKDDTIFFKKLINNE